MAEVTLKINNRGYSLACDDGQEQRLVDLSHYVDSRLKDIAAAGAATNEAHLLVLTSLVLADEIYEMKSEMGILQENIRYLQQNPQVGQEGYEEEQALMTQAIEHLAHKIERISARIHKDEESVAA